MKVDFVLLMGAFLGVRLLKRMLSSVMMMCVINGFWICFPNFCYGGF